MTSSLSRALLASLFAAAALSACSNNSSSSTCNTAADCPAGDTCSGGQCLAPGQCASGILSCSNSSQCGSGNVCTSGCCAPVEGCATSADCTSATRPHCDTNSHACVPCANNTQCSTGKICIVATGACEPACSSDSNCAAPTPHCVTQGGFCAQCTQSSQCPATAPTCTNNVCTGCTSNSNCSAPTPVCNTTTKSCVACLDTQNSNGKNTACPTTAPACESGACVVCNPADNADGGSNGACASATPSCSATSTCVACTQSSECAAGKTCDSSNTCQSVLLASFTSSASTVVIGGTATLTATLNGDVSTATTINVDIATDGGVAGSLSAATIVISSGRTGTVTYTAPSTDGTAVVEATLGSTTLSTAINVTSAAAGLSSIDVAGGPATPGTAVQATVSLSAAPAADTVVAVSVDNGATINGNATANITVPAGSSTSAAFTIQLACNASPTTATATLSGVTKTLVIPISSSAPAVASLTAASTSVGSGQPTTLTLTLSAAAGCGGTRATLVSSNIGFKTENKVNSYIPGAVTVPQGQTSVTFTVVPECTTNTTGDVIYFSAQVPGTPAVGITTPITMTSVASGTIGLCPISPVAADRPLTYLAADGGTPPLPTLLTVGFFASPSSSGAYSVSLTATAADGGSCGTFTQDGGPLPAGKLTLASATKGEVSFLPAGIPGPCTLAAQGANPAGTTTYDAGVLSTLNLINYDWSHQQTPTDLTLTKAEIDEDTNKVASLSDGGAVFGDATEYVEVYNPTSSTVDLSAYSLVFVGGAYDNYDGGPASRTEMWSFPLSGMLTAGHYAIAQDANTFATPPTANTDALLTWPDAGFAANVAAGLSATSTSSTTGALRDGNIANAPGGIFLVKNPGTANAAIVDGITYGAPIQQATSQSITGTAGGVFSWPPAPLIPLDNWITDNSFVKGSLVRIGYTGSPSLDWSESTTVTPGAPNTTITGP